jgi:hypothetical protein
LLSDPPQAADPSSTRCDDEGGNSKGATTDHGTPMATR